MIDFTVRRNLPLPLGRVGDNGAVRMCFPKHFVDTDLPSGGSYALVYRNPQGGTYPRVITEDAENVYWTVLDEDTQYEGPGEVELRYMYGADNAYNSEVWESYVRHSLFEPGDAPPEYQSWLDEAARNAANAQEAVRHYPRVDDETGNWFVWDADAGEWVDTEIHAQGPAGVSVVGAGISAYGKLMLNLSDGRSINCGKVTGEDGVSPTVAVTEIHGGHRVVITDEDGQHSFDVMDGESFDPSSKMDKENPSGTGSFSMNRLPNGTVGSGSVAVGVDNEARGTASFAEGNRTIASGECSHAEGSGSMATGHYSHSEGSGTTASGHFSHAEGSSTEARGEMSHAEGFGTLATPDYQHVQGKFNVEDRSGQFADIVGWGTNNTSKKNIEATTVEGDKRMKGDVYVGCNNDSSGGTKLATVAELESAIEALRAELGLT